MDDIIIEKFKTLFIETNDLAKIIGINHSSFIRKIDSIVNKYNHLNEHIIKSYYLSKQDIMIHQYMIELSTKSIMIMFPYIYGENKLHIHQIMVDEYGFINLNNQKSIKEQKTLLENAFKKIKSIYGDKFKRINELKHSTSLMDKIHKDNMKTYVLKDNLNGLYKIGRSKDPNKRLMQVCSTACTPELILVIDDDFEIILHNKFNNKRIKGEWFKLTEKDIKWIKERNK